jgi:hypothetical protein
LLKLTIGNANRQTGATMSLVCAYKIYFRRSGGATPAGILAAVSQGSDHHGLSGLDSAFLRERYYEIEKPD